MILLDTCVLSETLKPSPSESVLNWFDSIPEEHLYLPSLVLGEINQGIYRLQDGSRKKELILWLENLRYRFKSRILPIGEETALIWGRNQGQWKQKGIQVPLVDGLLSALSQEYDAIMATRNIRDFEKTGIQLTNPWEY